MAYFYLYIYYILVLHVLYIDNEVMCMEEWNFKH